jgi:hypothetical protein
MPPQTAMRPTAPTFYVERMNEYVALTLYYEKRGVSEAKPCETPVRL